MSECLCTCERDSKLSSEDKYRSLPAGGVRCIACPLSLLRAVCASSAYCQAKRKEGKRKTAQAMATLKNLKIKTGIGRRIVKEFYSYVKEVERETAKMDAMREANADAHDIKQQENVLSESKMMIPDVKKRLETALNNIQSAITEALKDEANAETEELKAAQELVSEAESLLAAA